MLNLKYTNTLIIFVVTAFVFSCSPNDNEFQESLFLAKEDYLKEGYPGQKIQFVISRVSGNEGLPGKTDIAVTFGTQQAKIGLFSSTSEIKMDVIVPLGYLDETVDITITNLTDQSVLNHFENGFTYKTPQIEVQQEVPIDSAIRIKIKNPPSEMGEFLLVNADGFEMTTATVKTEGEYIWLKCAGLCVLDFRACKVKWKVNESFTLESPEIYFRPFFLKAEKRNWRGADVLVLACRSNHTDFGTATLNNIPLSRLWVLERTAEEYDAAFAFPDGLRDGDYTITAATGENIPYIGLNGNTFLYDAPGPAVTTHTDIKLGGEFQRGAIGCAFSTSTGKVYNPNEFGDPNGPLIDIVFVGLEDMRFFVSPDEAGDYMPHIYAATKTDFINYLEASTIAFTDQMFDSMTNDEPLFNLSIEKDGESFPETPLPRIVLFKNRAGKKGAIKIKELVTGGNGYIVFDLKVQE